MDMRGLRDSNDFPELWHRWGASVPSFRALGGSMAANAQGDPRKTLGRQHYDRLRQYTTVLSLSTLTWC
jgi:hypothetical protein